MFLNILTYMKYIYHIREYFFKFSISYNDIYLVFILNIWKKIESDLFFRRVSTCTIFSLEMSNEQKSECKKGKEHKKLLKLICFFS